MVEKRRSIGRSSEDSRKEFEGVSDEVLSEQPISRIIDIRGRVELLGKGKLELIIILDSSACLYSYSTIYSESPTTPYRQPSVSLTLLYCDPSCCPLRVPTVTDQLRLDSLGQHFLFSIFFCILSSFFLSIFLSSSSIYLQLPL